MRKPYFSIFGLSDRRRSSTFLFLALLIDAEAPLFFESSLCHKIKKDVVFDDHILF